MMALSEQQWSQISKRSGVPVKVIKLLVGVGERSGQNSVSPMGARGRAQLMPGTARNLERKYHISTKGEFGNVLGGALYLAQQRKTFGNWRLAFAAYNAGPGAVQKYHGVPPYKETQDYVRRLMQALGGAAPDLGGGEVSTGSAEPPSTPVGPDFASLAAENLQAIGEGSFKPTEALGATALATQAAKSSASLSETPGATLDAPQMGPVPHGKWQKYVRLGPGADRAGVHTHEPVLQFVGSLGVRAGRRLMIGTGTQHSQMTVNGNVSDHWDGWAADIPATGKELIRLGRLALIQAGMPAREAMKQKGGLYNVHGVQVIFNTDIGGDHTNHLHVGLGGRR